MNRGDIVQTTHKKIGVVLDISNTPSGRNCLIYVLWDNLKCNWWLKDDLEIIKRRGQ